jgi:C-terminal domain found in long catalases
MALPGDGCIATRRIANVLTDGFAAGSVSELIDALNGAGAETRLLGSRLGSVKSIDGESFEIDATLEHSPAVLFDAMVVAGGTKALEAMALDGTTLEFIKDQYRHCKTILALGLLIEGQGVCEEDGEADAQSFIAAIGCIDTLSGIAIRHWSESQQRSNNSCRFSIRL